MTISLCMIVKNEEAYLDKCLSSIYGLVDEINIVDTGSTDKTKEIALKYTDRIYDFKWIDDFSAARNFSFSKASMEYQMWLDADDYIKEEDREILKKLKKNLPSDIDLIYAKYNVAFDKFGNPTKVNYRERFLKKTMNYKWVGKIHEYIKLAGKMEYSDFTVNHRMGVSRTPKRNLLIFEKMVKDGDVFSPRDTSYYARELYANHKYTQAIEQTDKLLNNKEAKLSYKASVCSTRALCYYALGDHDNALRSYFRSFEFSIPKAEICCNIAKHFWDRKLYDVSAFWYESALKVAGNEKDLSVKPDTHNFTPYIQLAGCYYRMGLQQKAKEYNEKAGIYKPYDKWYLYNKELFEST